MPPTFFCSSSRSGLMGLSSRNGSVSKLNSGSTCSLAGSELVAPHLRERSSRMAKVEHELLPQPFQRGRLLPWTGERSHDACDFRDVTRRAARFQVRAVLRATPHRD